MVNGKLKITIVLITLLAIFYLAVEWRTNKPIGIVHSLTGTMAISAKPLINGYFLAINELNDNNNLLVRKVQPIIVDRKSDPVFLLLKWSD